MTLTGMVADVPGTSRDWRGVANERRWRVPFAEY